MDQIVNPRISKKPPPLKQYGIKNLGAPLLGICIENTNRCPNDCIQCTRAVVMKRRLQDMKIKDFTKLVKSIVDSGLVNQRTWVHLGFAGEPIVHRHNNRLVDILISLGLPRVMIYTSLMCSAKAFEKFVEGIQRPHWDQVGVKTAAHLWQMHKLPITREQFYHRAWGTYRILGDRQQFTVLAPKLGILQGEVKRLAREVGVAEAKVTGRLPTDSFAMHGLKPRCECNPHSMARCSAWGRHITVTGDMTLCCLDQKPEMTLGNVFDDGFLGVWKKKMRFFDRLRAGKTKFPKHCQRCPSLWHFKKQLKEGFRR